MATPRLPFLYPAFFRQAPARIKPKRNSISPQAASPFSSGKRRRVETRPNQRYGTANEPPPHFAGNTPTPPPAVELTGVIGADKSQQRAAQQEAEDKAKADETAKQDRDRITTGGGSDTEAADVKAKQEAAEAATELANDMAERPIQGPYVPPTNPIETVLQMPAPGEVNKESEEAGKEQKPPHLATPRYVHHFDTWRLVGDLEKGGYTHSNSVDIMKATRLMLADNLEVARDALVSKSNVENETYLFKAACSELRTEIMNNRKAEMEKMRAQRTQLQHEVDVLNMKVDQQLKSMREELKGLFEDRKMNVKMEQRGAESRIQEINYKITVALNSDARSEVESLRWVLTRRAAMALAIVAIAVLGTLRYTAYMTQTQEEERKKMKRATSGGSGGHDGNPSADAGTQTLDPADLGLAGAASLADAQAASESSGRGFVALG